MILSCQDESSLKIVKRTRKYQFADQIQVLLILMSEFKSRCDKLIKGGVLEQFVAALHDALQSARSNRKQNTK